LRELIESPPYLAASSITRILASPFRRELHEKPRPSLYTHQPEAVIHEQGPRESIAIAQKSTSRTVAFTVANPIAPLNFFQPACDLNYLAPHHPNASVYAISATSDGVFADHQRLQPGQRQQTGLHSNSRPTKIRKSAHRRVARLPSGTGFERVGGLMAATEANGVAPASAAAPVANRPKRVRTGIAPPKLLGRTASHTD
jgi:hypothetical protein